MKKIFILSVLFTITLTFYISLFAFSTGIGGRTRKYISEPEIGCSCHRVPLDSNVVVKITGPATVQKGSTNIYKVSITGGPKIKAGFDFNVGHGGVDVAEPDSTQSFGIDITHKFPKIFGERDTISWLVKYIAPDSILGFDTLFATGNSVNGNAVQDSLDRWNFSEDFIVNVVESIGIEPVSSNVPESFKLLQNYPNPFNPATKILFSVPPSRVEDPEGANADIGRVSGVITLKIYDVMGREVANITPPLRGSGKGPGTYEVEWDGSNYPSGVYFYKLTAGSYSDTKKMILLK